MSLNFLETLAYAIFWAIVFGSLLYFIFTKLTPKKGFELLGEMVTVKCKNCGLVQVQTKHCRQCGNTGDTTFHPLGDRA